MNRSFEEYLKDNLVLLDGAMGSLIYERGVFIDKCYDELNLSNPDLIRSIHSDYIRAGAMVIETSRNAVVTTVPAHSRVSMRNIGKPMRNMAPKKSTRNGARISPRAGVRNSTGQR